jgi:hypothetical protein
MHRRNSRRAVLALAAASFAMAVAAAPASADGILLGDYACSNYAGGHYNSTGTLNIVAPDRYRVNGGDEGGYDHDPATNVVNFNGGSYQGFYGVWDPNKPNGIEIHDSSDGFHLWDCTHAAGSESQYPQGGSSGSGGGGGTPSGGGAPTGGGGDTGAARPAITIHFPRGVLLQPSLTNGWVVDTGVDQPATLVGKVTLLAKDARKYGLGKKDRVIARDRVANGNSDSSMEFVPSRAVAKKLKKAKKLTLLLTVTATRADGTTSTSTAKLKFK